MTAITISPGETDEPPWVPVSLADLVERMVDHHRIPVPVDRRLRVGAVAGLASVGVLTVVVGAGSVLRKGARPSVLLFGWQVLRGVLWGQPQASVLLWTGALTFSAGVIGAATTRGFARVRPSLLLAVFALVLLGCAAAVPLVVAGMILLANIATWVALGVLCAALVVAVIFGCVAALASR